MKRSWKNVLRLCNDRRVLTLFFLGFSAGLPLLLVFSTLSVWLTEAGIARSEITFLSWAGLAYGFKFIWAPLIDRIPAPIFASILGRRRGWLLLSQAAIIMSLCCMALTDPSESVILMAMFAVMLGFSSATQDIVIDAYRIELGNPDIQALLASTYMCGYRIAMIIAGAGALEIAGYFDMVDGYSYMAWRWTYMIMGFVMIISIVTTLVIREPLTKISHLDQDYSAVDHAQFFGVFLLCVGVFILIFIGMGQAFSAIKIVDPVAKFLMESIRFCVSIVVAVFAGHILLTLKIAKKSLACEIYLDPIREFVVRYGYVALIILALIAVYRVSDIVMGVIANVFYVELGFEKQTIGRISKIFGLIMTIVGSFMGGVLALRYGIMRILMLGAILASATNLLFVALASSGPDIKILMVVIAADNMSAGLASAAFVAYLSALVNMRFTATQYALFTSLMVLIPKLIAGYSGSMVDAIGYEAFFIATALLGLPVVATVFIALRVAPLKSHQD